MSFIIRHEERWPHVFVGRALRATMAVARGLPPASMLPSWHRPAVRHPQRSSRAHTNMLLVRLTLLLVRLTLLLLQLTLLAHHPVFILVAVSRSSCRSATAVVTITVSCSNRRSATAVVTVTVSCSSRRSATAVITVAVSSCRSATAVMTVPALALMIATHHRQKSHLLFPACAHCHIWRVAMLITQNECQNMERM